MRISHPVWPRTGPGPVIGVALDGTGYEQTQYLGGEIMLQITRVSNGSPT